MYNSHRMLSAQVQICGFSIKLCAPVILAIITSGCNSIGPPTAETDFEAKVKAGLQTSQDLLDQFKKEDQALRYISRDTYNCIDTKTERRLRAQKAAAPALRAELADKTSSVSRDLQYLDTYQDNLNNTKTR